MTSSICPAASPWRRRTVSRKIRIAS
jgi:hypothetical protein